MGFYLAITYIFYSENKQSLCMITSFAKLACKVILVIVSSSWILPGDSNNEICLNPQFPWDLFALFISYKEYKYQNALPQRVTSALD